MSTLCTIYSAQVLYALLELQLPNCQPENVIVVTESHHCPTGYRGSIMVTVNTVGVTVGSLQELERHSVAYTTLAYKMQRRVCPWD